MISLQPYLAHGLRALARNLDLQVVTRPGDGLDCEMLGLASSAAAQGALRRFHERRWPGSSPDPLENRLADLAEILVGLNAASHGFAPQAVFVRCLSASGRRVSEPGVDVIALRMRTDGLDERLYPDELLRIGEAKHTVGRRVDAPIQSLLEDVEKTDYERLRDQLQLLLSRIEESGEYAFPERLNKFLEGNHEFVLSTLIDPSRATIDELIAKAKSKFTGLETPSHIPVTAFVAAAIEELVEWTTRTL